jgi:hypothetical protein
MTCRFWMRLLIPLRTRPQRLHRPRKGTSGTLLVRPWLEPACTLTLPAGLTFAVENGDVAARANSSLTHSLSLGRRQLL